MKKLIKCIKGYTFPTIMTPILVIGEVILEVLIPAIMAKIVDVGIPNQDLDYIVLLGLMMVGMSFVSLLCGGLAGWSASVASSGFAKNIRQKEFKNIQSFAFANIDKYSTASLVTRLTTDVTNTQQAFTTIIRMLVRAPIMFVVSLIASFMISVKMTLIFLCVIPFLAVGLYIMSTRAHPNFRNLFKKYDALNSTVQEDLVGIRVVKAYVREDHEIKKFNKQSEELQNYAKKAEKVLAFNMPMMQLAMYLCMILIFWVGGREVISGATNGSDGLIFSGLTNGNISTLISYALMLLNSLMMISMCFVMIVMSRASIKRIIEVLEEIPEIEDGDNPDIKVETGTITFKDVNFSYCKDMTKLALQDVNLEIKSGQTIGIIGGTGTAKTTLVQLVPRLYDVTSGEIFVGGHNVKEYTLNNLRNNVAMVLQKNVLFSGTIKENLLWGDEHASDEEIVKACKLAQAHDFIESFPKGYETDLGQGGVNVSGGQKQRLCIARALLKKPKILILDDSTSAVDTKTDALIRKAFREELADTTKIIIAQRISSIEDADQIIVMDDGKISAIGSHETLLATSEIYHEVYESQVKGADDNE